MKLLLLLLSLLVISSLAAQEEGSLTWDIDTIFDEPLPEPEKDSTPGKDSADVKKEEPKAPSGPTVASLVRRRGIRLDAAFEFMAGLAPGWAEAPWLSPEENEFLWGQNVKMRADFGLDAQISEIFRVRSVFYFTIPAYNFTLGDFFFDYSIYDRIFLRAGKYNLSWGISPNFAFSDLLARVPADGYRGQPYVLKADIPVGIGGIQLLALTRANLMRNVIPGWKDIGFGGKFNLAFPWADFDLGVFYLNRMPMRGFFSIKTTLWDTEIYNEWLGVKDVHEKSDMSGAVNLGFFRDFFGRKFSVNGEVFYNAEGNAYWYRPETNYREAEISPFINGFNLALNLIYRFDGKGSPRVFIQSLYAPQQKSAHLVPGFRISPWTHAELYLAVPMSLGSRDGYYYSHTEDPLNRPFSVVLMLTLKGRAQVAQYY